MRARYEDRQLEPSYRTRPLFLTESRPLRARSSAAPRMIDAELIERPPDGLIDQVVDRLRQCVEAGHRAA